MEREVATAEVNRSAAEREDLNPAYNMLLRSELLGCHCPSPISPDKAAQLDQLRATGSPGKRMLRFKCGDASSPVAGPPPQSPFFTSPVGAADALGAPVMSPRRPPRKIPRAPFKVLDAPALADDFYLNLVDWSAQNVLAVGLGACVYLWSASTSKVTKLCDLAPTDAVCSVAWSQRGTYLSVGTNGGDVQIWDVSKLKRVRTMGGHKGRVGTQCWASHVLSSGSRDRTILQRDVRVAEPYLTRLAGHRSEVCGLRWSPDDRQLASGGNDNALLVWDAAASAAPALRFAEHTAAVKAIAWSPHQHGLLASGGGTADRCIRFWNTATGAPLSCVDTGSQVCNLAWSRNVNEIVSAHGYSQNQVVVWKYPSMTKLAALTGHSYRVLYLAVSPDGQTIVTGAGDETLRFWNVFPGSKGGGAPGGGGGDSSVSSLMRTRIR
ncbi:MAG: activator and specificity factor for anaphase promoting complex [Monoraphidium minutum]|nr:MAG: activator and specificity factor for anaphase promoting complex [Monoraphidium minutum]